MPWGALISTALQIVLGLFGFKKSDPNKPTVSDVVKPSVEAAKAEVHEQVNAEAASEIRVAIAGGAAADAGLIRKPDSLRDRDEFSRD